MAGDDAPSKSVLERVSRMEVTAENGARVQFGEVLGWDLGTHSGKPPVLTRTSTVVVFLRHFWCPNCQDYVSSIMHDVDHDALSRSGVKLVLVGCGSYGLIKSYRHIFDLPYPIYTDSSQQLYRALGLHMTEERSIPSHLATHMHPTHQGGGARYVKHKSVGAFAMVVRRALKVGMPVWEKGGDAAQLGGEFVFGPDKDRTCAYAHRMLTKSGHADVRMVLAKAGFGTPLPSPTSRGSGLWFVSAEEEAAWMESRRRSLVRMKEKREMRRASVDSRLGFNAPTMITTPLVLDGDDEATVQPSPAERGRNRDKRTTATLSIVREDGRGDGGLEMEWGGSSESMGSVVIISHAQGSSSDASTSATSSASASA
ncbi:uncharacterized protein STEHIDRAFT_48803 [Stereum hirsutum FP-91666 SS1]|uniref:uncharacterized protein n=1 Tax=Stereum hirsutum (strain FP-91666) TaxID=721885 RepID=UPI0004409F8D|nr:uncharacterized protein STEHIDRAFT_48803 [Stereum hirsutum FP-91666 SS1]EIM90694.1 hypothetical protein STEHIDRAFT_48803 [Stereum hirsutum FP-91666 SS1]